MARLHAMIGEQLGEDADAVTPAQVSGSGSRPTAARGCSALVAAGYTVFAVNPLQAARYRERHGVSGAKSDAADAHMLADMVRTDSHQLRPVAGDSPQAEAIKVVARAHKTLIWERTRHVQRLRHALREYFPAALEAFEDLDAAGHAGTAGQGPGPGLGGEADPQPDHAPRSSAPAAATSPSKATRIQAALRSRAARPAAGRHRRLRRHRPRPGRGPGHPQRADQRPCKGRWRRILAGTRTLRSTCPSPALGVVLGARVLAEFGDDPRPLRRRQGPQELRRHQPDHPRVRQEEGRRWPGSSTTTGSSTPSWPRPSVRAARLTRRPRLLRPAARPRAGPQRRPAPARQPPRRHPARLPQDPHPLRRSHRLVTPQSRSTNCRLTSKLLGCLPGRAPAPG